MIVGDRTVTDNTDWDERRGAPRFDTGLGGQLVCSRGSRHSIEISDLSAGGFSMPASQQNFSDRVGYAVKYAGLETLGAQLRWAGTDSAGFRFDHPLHPAVVDHVVRENPPADDALTGVTDRESGSSEGSP